MRDKCNYPALRSTQKEPPTHCSDRAQSRSRQHPGQMLTHRDTAPPDGKPVRTLATAVTHHLTLGAADSLYILIHSHNRVASPRTSRRSRPNAPALEVTKQFRNGLGASCTLGTSSMTSLSPPSLTMTSHSYGAITFVSLSPQPSRNRRQQTFDNCAPSHSITPVPILLTVDRSKRQMSERKTFPRNCPDKM